MKGSRTLVGAAGWDGAKKARYGGDIGASGSSTESLTPAAPDERSASGSARNQLGSSSTSFDSSALTGECSAAMSASDCLLSLAPIVAGSAATRSLASDCLLSLAPIVVGSPATRSLASTPRARCDGDRALTGCSSREKSDKLPWPVLERLLSGGSCLASEVPSAGALSRKSPTRPSGKNAAASPRALGPVAERSGDTEAPVAEPRRDAAAGVGLPSCSSSECTYAVMLT